MTAPLYSRRCRTASPRGCSPRCSPAARHPRLRNPRKRPSRLICPPAEKPVCPTPGAPPPPEADAPRTSCSARSWIDLPDWGRETLRDVARRIRARLPGAREAGRRGRASARAPRRCSSDASERDLAAFFELNFDPYQVLNARRIDRRHGHRLLRAAAARQPQALGALPPIRSTACPQDLLIVDLSSVYPELKNTRLRGRIEGNRVVPYLARGDIERERRAAARASSSSGSTTRSTRSSCTSRARARWSSRTASACAWATPTRTAIPSARSARC